MSEENLKNESIALPIGANKENITKFLDAVKRKSGDEKGINAIYGGAQFGAVRRTLEALGLIKDYALTELGKEIMYSNNADNIQELYFKAIMQYQPYEYCLTFLSQSITNNEIKATDVKNFWGKNNYGTGERNREDAFSTFVCFLELAGIGQFTIGRRGNESRLTCHIDLKSKIDNFNIQNEMSGQENGGNVTNEDITMLHNDTTLGNLLVQPKSEIEHYSIPQVHSATNLKYQPTININVDMSDWENEKIEFFFKALYGEQ